MNIQFPKYAYQLNQPYRYKVLAGGRGSAKSYTVARKLLLKGLQSKRYILCGREFQNSITESVHRLLAEQINVMELDSFYSVTNQSIVGLNGTEFFFKGVKNNINSIKSIPGITDLWLEEAQTVSKFSWDVLTPTIREPDSEIWVTFNPENDDDPTYAMFFDKQGNILPREDALVLKVNWNHNPWFPDILRKEKDHLMEVNPDLALHVWEGQCRKNSASQIFRNKYSVREFEFQYGWDGPYFGADWGFSVDPTCLVKMYIHLHGASKTLYVRDARYGFGVEIDQTPALFDQVSESRTRMIRADCARPETISYISRQGFNIEAAEKWPGSVEDGIAFLKSFDEIVIHPDCEANNYGLITEMKNYSFKTDRLTGDILNVVVDAYNHGIDAIRYGLQPLIKTDGVSILDVL